MNRAQAKHLALSRVSQWTVTRVLCAAFPYMEDAVAVRKTDCRQAIVWIRARPDHEDEFHKGVDNIKRVLKSMCLPVDDFLVIRVTAPDLRDYVLGTLNRYSIEFEELP